VVTVALLSLGYFLFLASSILLWKETNMVLRFPLFVPLNILAYRKLIKLFNVLMAVLVVEIVSRIELCEHSLLRNRNW